MTKYWIAVASKEHVTRAKKEGIAQVCHGKQNPLKRMHPGDWIIYYSPTELFGQKEPFQKFTALGTIKNTDPYQFAMSDTFIPWRRDVDYIKTHDVAIKPLLDTLSFIKNKKQWGMYFRYGLFTIPYEDFVVIASHMGVSKWKSQTV
jgi:predicted RNA-binding protein